MTKSRGNSDGGLGLDINTTGRIAVDLQQSIISIITPISALVATMVAVYLGHFLGSKKEETSRMRDEKRRWFMDRRNAYYKFSKAFLELDSGPIQLWEATFELNRYHQTPLKYRSGEGYYKNLENLLNTIEELCIDTPTIDAADYEDRVLSLKGYVAQILVPSLRDELMASDRETMELLGIKEIKNAKAKSWWQFWR